MKLHVTRMLVVGAMLCATEAHAQATRPASPASYAALSVTAGADHNRLDALDAALADTGYEPIGSLVPFFNLALTARFGRMHLGFLAAGFGWIDVRHRDDDRKLSVGQPGLELDFGYSLVTAGPLDVFVNAGVHTGTLKIEGPIDGTAPFPHAPGGNPASFEAVRRDHFGAVLALDVAYRVPWDDDWGFLLSARLGYYQQLHLTPWLEGDLDDDVLHGGPDIDTSGPFARLGLGAYHDF